MKAVLVLAQLVVSRPLRCTHCEWPGAAGCGDACVAAGVKSCLHREGGSAGDVCPAAGVTSCLMRESLSEGDVLLAATPGMGEGAGLLG